MSDQKLELLNELSFTTNEEKWINNLEKVKEFVGENNRLPIVYKDKKNKEIKNLGTCWCSTQNRNYNSDIKKCKNIMKNQKIKEKWEEFMEENPSLFKKPKIVKRKEIEIIEEKKEEQEEKVDYENLKKYKKPVLIKICKSLRIKKYSTLKKQGIIDLIQNHINTGVVDEKDIEETKKESVCEDNIEIENREKELVAYSPDNIKESCLDDWEINNQLGETGKEGATYEVINKKTGQVAAMKVFKKKKSKKTFKREVDFQIKAGNLAPRVICYSYIPTPRIIMEKMTITLVGLIENQNGKLTSKQQNEIIELNKNMDKQKINHGDPNPLNIMIDEEGNFKYIDYGFSKILKRTNLHSLEPLIYNIFRGIVNGYNIIKEEDISILVNEVDGLSRRKK